MGCEEVPKEVLPWGLLSRVTNEEFKEEKEFMSDNKENEENKAKMKDIQARKWLLTINQPEEKGYTHEFIREQLRNFNSCIYWCMSDEIGTKNKTYHTHLYMVYSSAMRFSTLKKRFPEAHIDKAKGTNQENRDYIMKEGKWKDSEKAKTKIEGTQEESGTMPIERQGARNDIAQMYECIKSGMSDYEIIESYPDKMFRVAELERVRQMLIEERNREKFRHLEVVYIWGDTGTGKTRNALEKHGYSNVYRVTNYVHPFDTYRQQEVIVFDEFRSNLPIGDMLQYLDGYPLNLPCRYLDKMACYDTVYIISNIPLENQYKEKNVDFETKEAFYRRFTKLIHYEKGKEPKEYSKEEYLTMLIEQEREKIFGKKKTDV